MDVFNEYNQVSLGLFMCILTNLGISIPLSMDVVLIDTLCIFLLDCGTERELSINIILCKSLSRAC